MAAPQTIGEFIRLHRAAKQLSQADLGHALGVGQTTVSNWENGYNDIRREDFVRVAEALEVPESAWSGALKLPVKAA